ncbi:glycosyltransferase [Nitrosomonas supralitoralis]|uniref:Glycosyl transferase family 2 n=1 Tax=Nitrosomonas supralitoralis TaxID=2116706 RepID=A0A2P7NW41_9PROT|nr:glycosyltransferase [Nitrosomonas supralitoralis]PSJ17645.1 glycosyl transferase family 2 [Nitrosomonas supralitoralis]
MRSDSVIIPCYQDEVKLMHLPKQLHQLSHHPAEIIVVDGADNKKCREICNQYHVLWLSSKPCRGQQLLAGVALAQGDVLWFLHADARLPPDLLSVMTAAFEHDAVGVIFVFALTSCALGQRFVLESAIVLRCRFGGVPYGDQGLFILRQAYIQVGGHALWSLYEEVPLARSVRCMRKFLSLSEPIFVHLRH